MINTDASANLNTSSLGISSSTTEFTVSILTEIPESLHTALQAYLDTHPKWGQDRVMTAALSLFLLQNGSSDTDEASQNYRKAARIYLDTLFKEQP